jgi:hypothetical protein
MSPLPVRASLAALALSLSACGPTETTPSSSTGAFGVVTVGGVQKLYLPLEELNEAGHAQVAVVDVGKAGNGLTPAPALLKLIDLGTSEIATATGGDDRSIIAVSTSSARAWIINPQADTLVKSVEVASANGLSSFSGGGGRVTGVAMDSEQREAILSVWNGFAVLDADTGAQKRTLSAPPVENFGYDPVRRRVYAPFYGCTDALSDDAAQSPAACSTTKASSGEDMTDGMTVVDLADGTVYVYQDASAPIPSQPLGGEPDSAAVDLSTQVVVVPSESNKFQNVLDFSRATFDRAARTVTAPAVRLGEYGLEGVAIESNRHLAFLEEEFGNTVGVVDLSRAMAGTGEVRVATMPELVDGPWGNMGDPHGIAVTTSLSGGRPVGFLVDASRRFVARVDLERLQAEGKVSGDIPVLGGSAVTLLEVK